MRPVKAGGLTAAGTTCRHSCTTRHALALDEYALEGSGPKIFCAAASGRLFLRTAQRLYDALRVCNAPVCKAFYGSPAGKGLIRALARVSARA